MHTTRNTTVALLIMALAGLCGCQKEIKEIRNPNQPSPTLARAD